jgi:uncharacterized protein YbaR (Trm112 family)
MKELRCPYCGNLLAVKSDEYSADKKDYFVCEDCHSMLHTSGEKQGQISLELE